MLSLHAKQTSSRAIDYERMSERDARALARRRVFRLIFRTSLTCLILATAWRGARQLQYLYWQRQAMNHTLPAGTVVYSPSAGMIPPPPGFMTKLGIDRSNGAYVLIHGRVSSGGIERLIAITGDCDGANITAAVYTPATFSMRSLIQSVNYSAYTTEQHASQIFAGEIDESDPAHFVIPYRSANAQHILDGWLNDDGSITLRERPATQPASGTSGTRTPSSQPS